MLGFRRMPPSGRPEAERSWFTMEACATAQHWARTLIALGHDVRLIAPKFVKPYVKNQKNDMADAKAIMEAAS